MSALETATRIRGALQALNSADLNDPRLVEVLTLSEQLVDAMKAFFGAIDSSTTNELRYIATYIARTREEISALRPNEIRDLRLPSAGAELAAIVKNTECATNEIMAAAEVLMASDIQDAEEYRALVEGKCMEIFQACSFQDITGQRVRKVVDTLQHIEERVARFANVMGAADAPVEESLAEQRRKALLLNGPALNGPEVSQGAVDAFFSPGPLAGQADIDKLFA